jgi:amino acid transporter
MFFCGMSSVTANSRLIFAISRDRVLPGWRMWSRVGKTTKTPTLAVWLATGCALVLGLPYLYNPAAFTAITSINVIGLFSAYGIPIYLRLRRGEDFEPGPFSLGRHSRWICTVACIWICSEMVLFVLPQAFPITLTNFNYAGPAVLIVLLLASAWWLVSARRSYTGPISYGTPEELAALDGELV